jgi:hypothetical protein|tara:strand:- start:253 stop:522 length:270 start_codon:yes stop_codon:yes gene_type:complete
VRFLKSKNYIIKRRSSVNATKTKDQKGVNTTREMMMVILTRVVRENCVLLYISKYIVRQNEDKMEKRGFFSLFFHVVEAQSRGGERRKF